jgi:mevalonate kinase
MAFEPFKCEFTAYLAEEKLCDKYQNYLSKQLATKSGFSGIKVHFLSEIPMGHSMGSNGAIAACLAQLINDKTDFDSTLNLAREILSFSQAGNSSGVSAYTALIDSTVPIVFKSSENEYFASPVVPKNAEAVWPLDFGLIFTGTQTTLDSMILTAEHTIEELNAKTKNISKLLGGKIKTDFKHTYIDMLNMVTALAINSFSHLLTKGTDNIALEKFFSSINQYHNLLIMLDVSSGTIVFLYSKIHAIANKQVNDVGSGVKISGLGKGGSVLFAIPFGAHRNEIFEMISQLRTATGRNVWLDYASWIDGVGSKAGCIEQDLEHNIHSNFIDQDARNIKLLIKGKIHQTIVANENFAEFTQNIDLLVDKTTGKLFIAGKDLTSKELPSQKATVSIISEILAQPNFKITNDQIDGSYGCSRYDLQGKITLPLIKQVKLITGRDLQLNIAGSMYDNYTLSLNPANISIGIVECKI